MNPSSSGDSPAPVPDADRPQNSPLIPLSRREIADLKARAQHLNPVLKLGKAGLTPAFVTSLGQALRDHSLLKVKFLDFKDERHELAARLAAEAGCHLVAVIGHVAIFYQPPANPGPKKEST